MFNIDINKDVVRRVLQKYQKYSPGNCDGPSWLAFLANMKDSLWSIDLFRCESISLQTYWVMVIMDQFSRRIIGFATHAGNLNGIAFAACLIASFQNNHCLYFYRLIMMHYFNINAGRPIFGYLVSKKLKLFPISQCRIRLLKDLSKAFVMIYL